MICETCLACLEEVEVVPLYGQRPPAVRYERLWTHIQQSQLAGCSICDRLTSAESLLRIGDHPQCLQLQYRIRNNSDKRGYFDLEVEAHSGPAIHGIIKTFVLLQGPATHQPDQRFLGSRPATNVDRIKRYLQWRIRACVNEHTECRAGDWWRPEAISGYGEEIPESDSSWRPTRLLQIVENDGSNSTTVQVVETMDNACGPYAALSHCWGGSSPLALRKHSYPLLAAGITCDSLPKTFRDAIQVARWLGLEYVWIDSLCILQDSAEDWTHESTQMHRVYQFGEVTIAASASADSEGGLFFETQTQKSCAVQSLKLRGHEPSSYRIINIDLWNDSVESGPLRKRAWTLQERMLSRRVLHFGKEQVFFQCARQLECETYPADSAYYRYNSSTAPVGWSLRYDGDPARQCAMHIRIALDGHNYYDLRRMWRNIVQVYSRCDLTYQTDKLVAVGGLAKWLQCWHGHQYYAGLWEEGMIFQLYWTVADSKQANGEPSKRPDEYLAPSWSWASVIGAVDTPFVNAQTYWTVQTVNRYAMVIEVEVEKAGISRFGRLKGGYLIMRGQTFEVTLRELHTKHYDGLDDRDSQVVMDLDVGPVIMDDEVVVLPLWQTQDDGRIYTIVLKRVYGSEERYMRVGAMTLSATACHNRGLNIKYLPHRVRLSETWDGSDILYQGFKTITII